MTAIAFSVNFFFPAAGEIVTAAESVITKLQKHLKKLFNVVDQIRSRWLSSEMSSHSD